MDVRLTDEQQMLCETAERLAARIGVEQPHDLDKYDGETAWKLLADAGLLSLLVPESAGGMGGTTVDAALVSEALARHHSPAPFLGSAGLATDLLVRAGAETSVLESLGSGERRVAVGFDPSHLRIASPTSPSVLAFDAAGADAVLVLGEDRRLVALSPDGATVMPHFDVTRIVLRVATDAPQVELGLLGEPLSDDALDRWSARALTLLSADLVGTMHGALDLAVGYAMGRRQFGVPIGSFQAIQHLLADQKVSVEASRSIMWYAAWAAENRPVSEALVAARSAKGYSSEVGRVVGEATIQVHGGIGITWECAAHLFLKRILHDRALLGDEHDQVLALAAARYGVPAAAQENR